MINECGHEMQCKVRQIKDKKNRIKNMAGRCEKGIYV